MEFLLGIPLVVLPFVYGMGWYLRGKQEEKQRAALEASKTPYHGKYEIEPDFTKEDGDNGKYVAEIFLWLNNPETGELERQRVTTYSLKKKYRRYNDSWYRMEDAWYSRQEFVDTVAKFIKNDKKLRSLT